MALKPQCAGGLTNAEPDEFCISAAWRPSASRFSLLVSCLDGSQVSSGVRTRQEDSQVVVRIAGIDGCPAGWLRIVSTEGSVAAELFSAASALFRDAVDFAVIAIDIPIGLPDAAPRSVDRAARQFSRPRGSSVFPAPVRATLDAADYADACTRSRSASGKALSKQAFAILPKIREVDEALQSDGDLCRRVYEVHPEVCFRAWNGAPLMESKKSGTGFSTRFGLVESAFPGVFGRIRNEIRRRDAGDDDILDAFAALWTANRILQGTAISLPGPNPPRDSAGLPMRMLA
jgi:predicted RNase H-like nuclease